MSTASEVVAHRPVTAQNMSKEHYENYYLDVCVTVDQMRGVEVMDESVRNSVLFDLCWGQAQRSAYSLGVEFDDRRECSITVLPNRPDMDNLQFIRFTGNATEAQWAFQARKRIQMAEDSVRTMQARLGEQERRHGAEMNIARSAKNSAVRESKRWKQLGEEAIDMHVVTLKERNHYEERLRFYSTMAYWLLAVVVVLGVLLGLGV
jgi:hypothetical protein